MSAIIIDNKTIERLKALRKHADQNPYYINKENINDHKPAGDNPFYVAFILPDTKVVFSVENQDLGEGKKRTIGHLSVSKAYKIPPVWAVNEILPRLGFAVLPVLDVIHIFNEGLGTEVESINILINLDKWKYS